MTNRRAYVYALFITLIALTVRLSLVLFGADPTPPPLSDSEYYHVVARNLANGQGFSYIHGPSFFWPPGYPFFLAILYKTFFVSVKVALVANAIAGAATVFITFLIGRRLWDARTGLVGAAILALLPSHIFWTPVLLSEVLFTAVFAAALLAAIESTTSDPPRVQWPALIAFAGFLAAGTLIRGQMLVLLPVACLFWWRQRVPWPRVVIMATVPLLVASAFVGVWMIRNQRVFGVTAVLSANVGYNLRIGHNPHAYGRFQFLRDFWPPGQEGNLTPERERAFNRDGTRDAVKWALTHPINEVPLSAAKVYWLYRADVDSWIWIESFYVTPFPSVDLRFALIRTISASYYVLLALALLGAPLVLGVRTPTAILFSSIFVLWTAVHVLFFGEPRFHVPLFPLAVLMAARFILAFHERWREIGAGASSYLESASDRRAEHVV